MSILLVCRGLPGSGKSTWAKQWVAEDPAMRARVNRDDLRAMLHDGVFIPGQTEQRVIAARDAQIAALLREGDVVCDDTNLPQRVMRDLAVVVQRAGAELRVQDFTGVPVEVCIERDAARDRPVGEEVIRRMYDRFLRGRDLPLPVPVVSVPADIPGLGMAHYVPPEGAPKTVLADIDGTTAKMSGRSPYDESRVGEDLPNPPVIETITALWEAGHRVVFMSGRSEACRAETEKWLFEHVPVPYDALHMRRASDRRRDWVVKAELFDRFVRERYNVTCVLDDRDQVVQMLRRIGLDVFQVGEGDF